VVKPLSTHNPPRFFVNHGFLARIVLDLWAVAECHGFDPAQKKKRPMTGRILLTVFVFVAALSWPGAQSLRAQSPLSPEMVQETLDGFESALNAREGKIAALRFLNGHIGDEARFYSAQSMPQSKETFINAALFGTREIADYALSLAPVHIAIDREGLHADVLETVTERGAPVSGLAFAHVRHCESRYALTADGSLILSARRCSAPAPEPASEPQENPL